MFFATPRGLRAADGDEREDGEYAPYRRGGPGEPSGRSLLIRIGVAVTFSLLAGLVVGFVLSKVVWAKSEGGADTASDEAPRGQSALRTLTSEKFINTAADGLLRLGRTSKHLKHTGLAKIGGNERHLLAQGMTKHVEHIFARDEHLSRMLSELDLSDAESAALLHVVDRMFDHEILEVGLESVHAAIEGVVPGVVSGMMKGGSLLDIRHSVVDEVLELLPHKDYIRKLADELVPPIIRDNHAQGSMRKKVLEDRLKFVMQGAARHTHEAESPHAAGKGVLSDRGSAERRLFWQNTPINWFSLGAPVISASLGILFTTLMGRLPGIHQEADYAMWGIEGAAMVGDCLANIGYPCNVVNFAPCIIDVLFFGAEAAFVFLQPYDDSTPAPTPIPPACAVDSFSFMLADMTVNNLGGTGPNLDSDPVMRFPNVGTYNGVPIDVVVSSAFYTSGNAGADNGLFDTTNPDSPCCTAQISQFTGDPYEFRIALVDYNNTPIVVDQLQLAVFGLDTGSGHRPESLTIGGTYTYITKLDVATNVDGTRTFTATTNKLSEGVGDPLSLTSDQADQAVGFLFEKTHIVQGVFDVVANEFSQFQFAGSIQGVCTVLGGDPR